ncbi:hypothetical protein [Thermomonospora echinospora]|nr:hypothetical protein [Thermomonospora echinospora]
MDEPRRAQADVNPPEDTPSRPDPGVTAMTFTAAADLLVVARANGRVESWRIGAPSTPQVVRAESDDPVLDLVTDGPRILGVSARHLLVWNAAMEPQAEYALEHPAYFVTVTPRGVWLAGDSHVARLDRDLGEARWTPISEGRTTDFDVHPSEKRFVVVKDRVAVRVHDAGGAELHAWDRKARRNVRRVSVRFADRPEHLWEAANRDWMLGRVSAKSGRQVGRNNPRRKFASAWAGPLALCPDRRFLAVLQTGRDVQVWDLDLDGPVFYAEPVIDRSQEKLMASLSRVPAFAPAGPGEIKVVARHRQPDRDAPVTALAISAGGTMVALGDRAGTVHRCEVRTGAIERLGASGWQAAPHGLQMTRWARGVAHGVRDGERWIVHQGRLARLDFAHPDHIEGVVLDGFPAGAGSGGGQPSIFFRDDLVWHADRGGLRAWEIATGRLVWHLETPGVPEIAGDAAYLIEGDFHYSRDRFPLVKVDLATRAMGEPGDFEIDRSTIDLSTAPVNWPQLHTIGPHVVLELYSRPERAFLIDPERRVLKRELPEGVGLEPHDGRRVLHQVPDGYAVIDLADPDAEPRVHKFGDPIRNVRWHLELGDDRVVGWDRAAQRIVVASRTTGELLGHFAGHGAQVFTLFASPDERTLLSVDAAGFVRTWRL